MCAARSPEPRPGPRIGSIETSEHISIERISAIAGAAVTGIGLLVLLGWTFDLTVLKRVAPGLVAMKPVTALALVASGGALVCLRARASARSKLWGRALGLLVAASGAAVGAEYLFGDLGFDQILFHDPSSLHPGRPSQHTAISLLIFGLALAATDRRQRLAVVLTTAFAIAVLFAVVGYVYGVHYLHSGSEESGIALHTLLSLILLSVGLFCLRPAQGVIGMTIGDDAGARMARTWLPVTALGPLALGIALFGAQQAGWVGVRVGIAVYTLAAAIGLSGLVVVTARRLREADLRRQQIAAHFQSLLEAAPDAIVIVDQEGEIVLVNREVGNAFGYSDEELIGRSIEALVPDGSRAVHSRRRQAYADEPEARAMGSDLQLSARRRDGSEFPVEISLSPVQGPEGTLVIAAIRDVTERRRTEQALAESEERFRRSFEDSGIGMVLVAIEDGKLGEIVAANDAFAAITGISTAQMRGMDPTPFVHEGELPASLEDLEQLLDGTRSIARREVRLLTATGEEVWAAMTGSVVRDLEGEPTYLVVQAQDVSERRHFEKQLQYLADHDPLTGLFNRRRVEEELERELALALRSQTGGAVLVMDLDHFKLVNDTLGHAVGDELITSVSQVLSRRLRSSDVIGRMGGDEFAIVLPRVDVEQACEVGRALIEDIRRSPEVSKVQGKGRVTASAGIATFAGQAPGVSAQDLLIQADIAMYDAKEAGRDRLTLFDPGSPRHERTRARVDWLERIEDALENDRFVLHAQPIMALDGDRRERFELLLRMISREGDLVPPGDFLEIAERSDLTQRIDHWVISRGVAMLAEQERRGRDVCFEINISGGSIGDHEISDHIAKTLAREEIDPSRLIFEVTETAAIVNVGRAKEFAERMQEIGCGFALDDFGAGFASFYYLKHLSFDLLKIDGEFIRNLPSSRTDQLVVQSVVEIARGLGKRTVAEFVGDEETIELLRGYGVDFAQGFYLGLPRPLEESESLASPSGSRTAD